MCICVSPSFIPTVPVSTELIPTVSPGIPSDDQNPLTIALISIAVLLCVSLGLVLLVLVLCLCRKVRNSKKAALATGGEMLYEEVDEGETGKAVALRSVVKLQLQTTGEPDLLYETVESDVCTGHNVAYGVTTISSVDVPSSPNAAYGVTTTPSFDVPTASNTGYEVVGIQALSAEINTSYYATAHESNLEEEDYI